MAMRWKKGQVFALRVKGSLWVLGQMGESKLIFFNRFGTDPTWNEPTWTRAPREDEELFDCLVMQQFREHADVRYLNLDPVVELPGYAFDDLEDLDDEDDDGDDDEMLWAFPHLNEWLYLCHLAGGKVSLNAVIGDPAPPKYQTYNDILTGRGTPHEWGYGDMLDAAESVTASPLDRTAARNPDLEAAILADFDQPSRWAVYADWLQCQGDPWGERVGMLLARASATGAAQSALNEALARHEASLRDWLLGTGLARILGARDIDEIAEFEWKHGFVVSASIGTSESEWTGTNPVSVLEALLRSPAARFLRQLSLGLFNYDDRYKHSYRGVLSELLKAGELPTLDHLFIGDFEYPDEALLSWISIGNLEPILRMAPNLRSLHLRGDEFSFGTALVHAKLESLLIETSDFSDSALAAIDGCRLPELRRLELWLGNQPFDGEDEGLDSLLSGVGVPALKHLGLRNSDFSDELARALARSSLLARLTRVDLSMGTLRDEGGQAILDDVERFAHLELLELDHNYLSNDVAEALQQALPGIVHIGRCLQPYEDEDGLLYYPEVLDRGYG